MAGFVLTVSMFHVVGSSYCELRRLSTLQLSLLHCHLDASRSLVMVKCLGPIEFSCAG